ncbi:MAG: chemotaxis protein CheC [Anaerolineaceae bacterium]|nr:chemotaxis protein CheC [Anaerolineaceae bacterium]
METPTFDKQLYESLQTIAGEGMHNAARGFSDLLGHKIEVTQPTVRLVPILDIQNYVGGPDVEAIGIYLRAEGELTGQIMLIIPYKRALELVDLLMEQPDGTTTQIGPHERSALGEVGNLTATFFMNSVASKTGTSIRPTPPAVMIDMIGAILDIIVASSSGISDHVLLMEANFTDAKRSVEAEFWVLPDSSALKALKIEIPK